MVSKVDNQIKAEKAVIKILFLALCLAKNEDVRLRLAELLAAESHRLLSMLEKGVK